MVVGRRVWVWWDAPWQGPRSGSTESSSTAVMTVNTSAAGRGTCTQTGVTAASAHDTLFPPVAGAARAAGAAGRGRSAHRPHCTHLRHARQDHLRGRGAHVLAIDLGGGDGVMDQSAGLLLPSLQACTT